MCTTNSINNYPSCYMPMMQANLANSQAEAIVKKVNDEVAVIQAYQKVQFIQNTLMSHNLTQLERTALENLLRDAQRDFSILKQQIK